MPAQRDTDNSLAQASNSTRRGSLLSSAALALAPDAKRSVTDYEVEMEHIEEQLDQLLGNSTDETVTAGERSRFYVNLNLMALLWDSLKDCEAASLKVDCSDLKQSRF